MSLNLPTEQTAIVGLETGELGIVHDVPLPGVEDDMILVRNEAVALNPIDTKMVGRLCTTGAVAGMDFAGTVIALGSKVTTAAHIQVGDRVCGAVQGMHALTPRVGAFAQYVGASGVVTLKIPDHLSPEQGASLGSGVGTICIALFKSLQVSGTPESPAIVPKSVLVYGGSTATGTLAIQLLKLSGLHPIATCSPRNFELVKSYGAEAVFYNDPDKIREHTENGLKFVLNCISEAERIQFCYRCIGRAGGKYTALEPYPAFLHTRRKVQPDWVLGLTLLGKPIGWGQPFERDGDPEMRDFAAGWFKTVQGLLDEGRLKPHPLQHMEGGLEGVLAGMDSLQRNSHRGRNWFIACLSL
ncbi:zinc-binding alcohol dehydrogenase family protein [Aspergillus foveolatus]|uniref:zinc-binding alcohol dehydrogenase family protein n=1 Tax=Aspergillus foveolatus TaxID=210207 RepID=UPI003CCD2B3A